MRTEELANYIEKLRYGRNISQENFLDDIISLRQYQRYRNGQSIMPIEILEKMAIRLAIPIKTLLSEFEVDKNKEAKIVTNFYNNVVGKNLEKSREILEQFKDYVFIDDEKMLIYESARLLFDYYMNKIALFELVKKQTDLINYPDMLKNDVITDTELLVLGTIFEYAKNERKLIISKLSAFLNKANLVISDNNVFAFSQIIYWIAKHHGSVGEYDEVIKFCDLGIKINSNNRTIYLMDYFYYYKSLVYYRTEQFEQFEHFLYKCILLLEVDKSEEEKKNFYDIILKDLKINPYEFLIEVAKKKIIQHFV